MHQDTGHIKDYGEICKEPEAEQDKWKEITEEQATFLKHRLNKAERNALKHMLQNNGLLSLQDMREKIACMRGFKK